MKAFPREEIETFLRAVDDALQEPVDFQVIGGSAAALHYGAASPTRDIDTWTRLNDALIAAVKKAQEATGLHIPVATSTIAEGPEGLEERMERILPDLRHLRVSVPERHDLVLMKTIRCDEHDLQAMAEIHAHAPLALDVLVQRFHEEMDPVGDPDRLRSNFLLMVERLFPDSVDEVDRQLPKRRYSNE